MPWDSQTSLEDKYLVSEPAQGRENNYRHIQQCVFCLSFSSALSVFGWKKSTSAVYFVCILKHFALVPDESSRANSLTSVIFNTS